MADIFMYLALNPVTGQPHDSRRLKLDLKIGVVEDAQHEGARGSYRMS